MYRQKITVVHLEIIFSHSLEGIGEDPHLVDKKGVRVCQMGGSGRCLVVDDCFVFGEE